MNLANTSSTKKTSSTTGSATTDSPYLGSKISLVSKAKIRYEGILYTIDANESTVALSKVRSFGTEDRPTDRPVPARDEIFEYIIFRGADIEDLQVREPPQASLTQDPAIVESSAYPDNARSTTIGTNTNLSGLAGNGPNRSLSNRGTMPSPPMQQGQGNKGYNNNKSSDPLRQFHFNQQRSNRSYNYPSPMNPYEGNARRYRPSQQQQQQDYYPMNRRNSAYPAEWNRPSQRFSRAVPIYENNRFYPSRRNQGQRQRRNSTGEMNTSSHRNNNRQQQPQQHQQQQQQGERTRSNGTSARSTLKFVGDFDFEKSNAEFDKNAIEDELKKSLSLKSTTKKSDETSNEQEQEKEKENQEQNQNQSEHQQDQQQQQQQQQQQTSPLDSFYDKQKSFFDCISCEANEKEKTSNRRNWNEERRVNAETFGLKYRPFQQNNGGNQRSGNRRNNGGRYQRANYSGRNAGYYGSFSNRVRVY